MKYALLPFLALCLLTLPSLAQPTAEDVLRKSIAYHDPDGKWLDLRHHMTLRETRPSGNDRFTTLILDNTTGGFSYRSAREGRLVEATLRDGACTATIDGSDVVPDSLVERYRLSCEGIAWWQAYYGYMHALPMNLTDSGTHLDPDVQTTTFMDREVYALRVTYDAEVGSDTWYFYIDPTTYALTGCRFYHDESANDGEYIVFEGEMEHNGIRLPKTLKWYINKDGEFLGADIMEAYETDEGEQETGG